MKSKCAARRAERTNYLNTLIQNTPFGIVIIDAAGHVSLCNPAFEHTFGHSREELAHKDLDHLIVGVEVVREMALRLSSALRSYDAVGR